jgi:hypothetical protein
MGVGQSMTSGTQEVPLDVKRGDWRDFTETDQPTQGRSATAQKWRLKAAFG